MIRVLRPSMPTADELLPLLREIDSAKTYTNGGPLVQRLERVLAVLVDNPCVAVSNGTVALELALRAMELPAGSRVLVPAVTYVATARAIVNAGLYPLVVDVDPHTWQLDPVPPEVAEAWDVSCVLPVAAFGAPVDVEAWETFTYETGLPVLIDAAGAIYGQPSSPIPDIVIAYSLHATKALGAGEGGLVATADRTMLDRIAALANFGPGGTNAKLSEYHAAVAHASLRRCSDSSDWRLDLGQAYERLLPAGITVQQRSQPARTLMPVLLPEHCDATLVAAELHAEGIETRAWYRPFLTERPEFADRLGPFPVTERLQKGLIGLPWHAWITETQVELICEALAEAIDPSTTTTT